MLLARKLLMAKFIIHVITWNIMQIYTKFASRPLHAIRSLFCFPLHHPNKC